MEKSSQDVKTHQSDQCYIKASSKKSLRQYMEKEHTLIQQLEGLNVEGHEEKSSWTGIVLVQESEVKTDTSDKCVSVKLGKSKELTLPPATVV